MKVFLKYVLANVSNVFLVDVNHSKKPKKTNKQTNKQTNKKTGLTASLVKASLK